MVTEYNNMIAIADVVNVIEKMPAAFDSHQFISGFIQMCPRSYGQLLVAHNNVTLAHAEIANFLRNNSVALKIKKTGESETDDIFGNTAKCALWTKNSN